MLLEAEEVGNGSDFSISFDGTDYTFGNSANNVFTGQITDFNYIFKDSKFNFKNEEQLVEKINEVTKLNSEELEQIFKTIDRSLKDNSLSTLNQRLSNYL